MKKAVAVVDALKRALRARGVTYADVAKALRLSEASVKRLFSSGHFTLERFEQVCEVARTSLSELAKSIDDGSEDITQLTLEQEREIMADHKLLLVALCALNHLTLEQMTQTYEVSKAECIRLLVALDRIKFLELLPNNRIKLRVYALGGALAGVAGLLTTARLDSATPTAGFRDELDSIAAVVIGGSSLNGGRGSIAGTLLGCLIIGILNNGLVLLEVSPFWQQVIKGFVILIAVAVDKAGTEKRS